jgi:hypothetical protein
MMATDYEIGFKRPPKASQFKKGESANPRGRPKGTRNLKTDLAEELASWVTMTVQGKKRTVSKQMVYRGGCGSAWMVSAHPLL